MPDVQYIGEHLLPGQIGHIAVVLGFVSALFGSIAYWRAFKSTPGHDLQLWRKSGRALFVTHGVSTLTIVAVLFYVMVNKYYEYAYAYQHVSNDLPMEYILSAFWEGQEGSFLLWMFWHIVLGFIALIRGGKWEAPVMAVMCLIQAFLASMLLGVHIEIGDWAARIGSNPTLLLRDTMQAPIFSNADYLSLLTDGVGLNILLQNYWNVIHPPVTFLGFASLSMPFAFAIAVLLNRDYKGFVKKVLPWALFSGGILGLGILMGSAWAYEALTFGGYWAWDPVENMSLVPWLMLIGGMHTNLIAKATGHSIRSTLVFYILAFILIVYSTYLTRSGALQDTSVHAFTEMGLGPQILLFIGFFAVTGSALLIYRWNKIPAPDKEEATYSREFWMFIGSLVIVISSILITYATSLPVFNKIIQAFNPDFKAMVIEDQEEHHNRYQLWVAILMAFSTSLSMLFRYGGKNWSKQRLRFWKKAGIHAAVSAAATGVIFSFMAQGSWQHVLLLFAALFALFVNADWLVRHALNKPKQTFSSLSHIGFAVLLIGILITGLNKRHITFNPVLQRNLMAGFSEEELMTNITLVKDYPFPTQGYEATYVRDTLVDQTMTFTIEFKEDGQKVFDLKPNVIYNDDYTEIAAFNPSIIRGAGRDIFSRVSGLSPMVQDRSMERQMEDTLKYDRYFVQLNDTIYTRQHYIVFSGYDLEPDMSDIELRNGDVPVAPIFEIGKIDGSKQQDVRPVNMLRGSLTYQLPKAIHDLNMRIKVSDTILRPFLYPPILDADEMDKIPLEESRRLGAYSISVDALSSAADHPHYYAVKGDITVTASLTVRTDDTASTYTAKPIYYIRDNAEKFVDAFIPELNLTVRLARIVPEENAVVIQVKKWPGNKANVPIYVKEEVPRSDWLALEAFIFPGVNLIWLGGLLMVIGLFLGWYGKRREA